jgi:hypothetical protein
MGVLISFFSPNIVASLLMTTAGLTGLASTAFFSWTTLAFVLMAFAGYALTMGTAFAAARH